MSVLYREMRNNISSRGLTIRYSIYQLVYYSISAGTSAFATTYLLDKGFDASQVGLLLAVSNFLSCLVQPLLGDAVDRLKSFVLPQIVAMIFAGSFCCFSIIQFVTLPLWVFGVLYAAGNLLLSVTNSLNNSLCAYYTNRNYPINYGVGTGLGSMAFSFASLGYGYVIALLGADWMIWIVLILLVLLIIVVLGYPKISGSAIGGEEESDNPVEERVSLWVFFGKYKLFTFTMIGVMLVAMCHSMSENYFIAIFQSIGGGSEDVGIAFFVSCLSAAPFFIFFERLKERINILTLLKFAGIFFMLKTVLLMMATEVWHVYLIQLLQTFTYGFIYQPLYYFAKQRISEADLVKGQAVAIALYTLGVAMGSLVGGNVLDLFGLDKMLGLALMIVFIGTIIIHITLKDEKKRRCFHG